MTHSVRTPQRRRSKPRIPTELNGDGRSRDWEGGGGSGGGDSPGSGNSPGSGDGGSGSNSSEEGHTASRGKGLNGRHLNGGKQGRGGHEGRNGGPAPRQQSPYRRAPARQWPAKGADSAATAQPSSPRNLDCDGGTGADASSAAGTRRAAEAMAMAAAIPPPRPAAAALGPILGPSAHEARGDVLTHGGGSVGSGSPQAAAEPSGATAPAASRLQVHGPMADEPPPSRSPARRPGGWAGPGGGDGPRAEGRMGGANGAWVPGAVPPMNGLLPRHHRAAATAEVIAAAAQTPNELRGRFRVVRPGLPPVIAQDVKAQPSGRSSSRPTATAALLAAAPAAAPHAAAAAAAASARHDGVGHSGAT